MRIEHVAVYVRDLEAARAFFERWFEARSSERYHNPRTRFSSYFLSFDGSDAGADGSGACGAGARLELMTRPEVISEDSCGPFAPGYAHLSFAMGSAARVDELTAQLAHVGYETLSGPRTTGDGYYESCVAGPEGIAIEITV